MTVLEGHRVAPLARVDGLPEFDDGAAEPVARDLDDQVGLRHHFGDAGTAGGRCGEDIGVTVRLVRHVG